MVPLLPRGTTPASYVTSTGMPAQNTATILKLLVPNPHSTTFTHGADWIAPFPRSQQSLPPPHKFFHTPPSPPPTNSLPPLRAREFGAISIIMQHTTRRYCR